MSKREVLELARRVGASELDVLEYFSERAAVREFEGGQSRADAERGALDDVRARFDDSLRMLAGPRRGPRSVAPNEVVEDDVEEA